MSKPNWNRKVTTKGVCYFCKKKIIKHKPNEAKWHLLMVSAYTFKLRSIYSRPDMVKAITKTQLQRLRDAKKKKCERRKK